MDTWCPEPDSLVLTGPEGQRMSSPGLWYLFDRARKAAGRPDLRWHDLRHTGAVMAGVAGATLPELMARLGHTTVDAAMVYQHAARSRDRELAALLSKMAAG
ncbi:MAG: tyrosine-type recombinase/integrase [Mycobacterium sp.]